jgi:transposase
MVLCTHEMFNDCDAPTIVLGLQDENRRSEESRYDHRLHGVLLVAQGMSCPEVGKLLGDAPRSVQYSVRRFKAQGLTGLVEGERPGRPKRLSERQLEAVEWVLRQPPSSVGLTSNLRDGKTPSAFIQRQYKVSMRVRQCQRLFRQVGFRLRKPRPLIARADPERRQRYKKTPPMGKGS